MKRPVIRLGACIALLGMTATVMAGNVMVLPTDGDADAALRTGITSSLEKVRKTDEGDVKVGGTTFAETAAAAGCDPGAPACAETVRTTLGVDELVYAMATTKDGQVVVVVRKKVKGKDPEEVTTTIAPTDPADKIEPAITPLIGKGVVVTCPDNAVPGPDGKCPEKLLPIPPKQPRPYRNYAILAGIGASVLLLSGFAMWSSESKLQGEIDDAPPPTTVDEFTALKDKEDRASSRAWFGNFLVASSIGVGYLTYRFWRKDRRMMRESSTAPTTAPVPAAPPTIAPAPVPGGAMLLLRFER
jgi:hypothetical protein